MGDISAVRNAENVAAPHPCKVCPWRKSNQGKHHKPNGAEHSFYTKKNLRRLWSGLRNGEMMSCHETDPQMSDIEGYEKNADLKVRECSGSLVLVQREMQRVSDAITGANEQGNKDGLKVYRKAHPKGLTKRGVFENVSRITYGGVPVFGGMKTTKTNLNEAEVSHPDLEPWETRQ